MKRPMRVLRRVAVGVLLLLLALVEARGGEKEGQKLPPPTQEERQKDLKTLGPKLKEANLPYGVVDAAILIVTKDATYKDLRALWLRRAGGMGFDRLVSEDETIEAMWICHTAGLSRQVCVRAIWNDYGLLHKAVEKKEALRKKLEDMRPNVLIIM